MEDLKVNLTKALFSPSLLSSSYPHLFRLLRHSALPCSPTSLASEHMVGRCRWQGQEVDCRDIFTPVATDSGICCAFNPRQLLKEGNCHGQGEDMEYSCLVKEIQEAESSVKMGKEDVRKAAFGRKKGLQVVLDQHSSKDSPTTLFDSDDGLKLHVGAPGVFPLLTTHHLPLSLGQQHTLVLGASHLSTTPRVRQLSVQARNCLLPEDVPEDSVYSEYSFSTCLFMCALDLASSQLGCTPWYLPSPPNSTMCNPWDAATFAHTLENTPQSSCSHCLPDCQATTYTVTALATPIRACDSRNLNLNPFCNLDIKLESNPWIKDVTGLYQASTPVSGQVPDYIEDIATATRPQYKYWEDQKMDVLVQDQASTCNACTTGSLHQSSRPPSVTTPWRPTWRSSTSTSGRTPCWVGGGRGGRCSLDQSGKTLKLKN